MTNTRLRGMLVMLSVAACMLVAVPPRAGQVRAAAVNFGEGNTTTEVDGFLGKAGEGWSSAWAVSVADALILPATQVPGSGEIYPGMGNYLDVSVQSNSDTQAQGTIARRYESYVGVDVTQPHTIEFFFRLDEEPVSPFVNGLSDQYFIFDNPSSQAGYNTGNDNSWVIVAPAAAWGSAATKKWAFYNGANDGSAFDENRLVDSGISLVQNMTYSFSITVDPAAGTYDVTIRDDASTPHVATQTGLGFQKAGNSVGQTINFGGNGNRTTDNREFSLDGLRIETSGAIRADFTGGNGTKFPDQYGGVSGNGWVDEWKSSASSSPTVVESNPIEGPGDSYLSTANMTTTRRLVARQYADFGEVSVSAPHEIRWKARFDDLTDFQQSGDRINFFGDNSLETGSITGNSWLVGVTADQTGFPNGNWFFFDGTSGSSFSGSNVVNTGIALATDTIYEFTVLVDPVNGLYDATISNGATSFRSTGLGFRNGDALADGFISNWIEFGLVLDDAGDSASFSLDSIQIVGVPEPGTLSLSAAALFMLAAFVARRRRRREAERAYGV